MMSFTMLKNRQKIPLYKLFYLYKLPVSKIRFEKNRNNGRIFGIIPVNQGITRYFNIFPRRV